MRSILTIQGVKSIADVDPQMAPLRGRLTIEIDDSLELRDDTFPPMPEKTLTFEDVCTGVVRNAYILQTGLVITQDGFAIQETLEGSLADNGVSTDENGTAFLDVSAAQYLKHPIIAACKFGTFNYSVFLHEILPNIYLSSLSTDLCSFPIPIHFPKFFSSANQDRLHKLISIFVDPSRLLTLESRVYQTPLACVFKTGTLDKLPRIKRVMPAMIADLMATLPWKTAGIERIYIQREPNTIRSVDNIEQISHLLAERGFSCVQIADLSVSDQIGLFNQAKVIVAEHGAGLANLWFSNPGTKVIELFPRPLRGRWIYRYVSHLKRLPYRAVVFDTPDGWVWNRDPITLPAPVIAAEIDQILRPTGP